jgi:hypothetical protein
MSCERSLASQIYFYPSSRIRRGSGGFEISRREPAAGLRAACFRSGHAQDDCPGQHNPAGFPRALKLRYYLRLQLASSQLRCRVGLRKMPRGRAKNATYLFSTP